MLRSVYRFNAYGKLKRFDHFLESGDTASVEVAKRTVCVIASRSVSDHCLRVVKLQIQNSVQADEHFLVSDCVILFHFVVPFCDALFSYQVSVRMLAGVMQAATMQIASGDVQADTSADERAPLAKLELLIAGCETRGLVVVVLAE